MLHAKDPRRILEDTPENIQDYNDVLKKTKGKSFIIIEIWNPLVLKPIQYTYGKTEKTCVWQVFNIKCILSPESEIM